jgi:hypothetical protein
MSNELDKWQLKFENLGGYIRGVRKKIGRKDSVKKHPFLKSQKLDKNWWKKLTDGREKAPKKAKV